MNDFDPSSLIAFVTQSAENAVRAQSLYDRAFESARPGASRMRISTFEIEAELDVSIARETAFSVRVSPLNLSYRIMSRDTEDASLRLTVRIEQAAFAAAPHHQENHGI